MKENEYFINDDWLIREKEREAKISIWDLDDNASSLKQLHHDNCEKEEVARNHHIRHLASENRIFNVTRKTKKLEKNKKAVLTFILIYMFFFIISLLISAL